MVLGVLAVGLAGCGAFDKLTGSGIDNTVLPGQREDAIPGRSQFPDAGDSGVSRADVPDAGLPPSSSPGTAGGCPIDDPACQPPSGDDTFSDPQ